MLKNIFKRKVKDDQPKEAMKMTGAPPPPQPTFFQKAKLRLLEITRKRQIIISPRPSSQRGCPTDYDSISTSKSNTVSQYEEPEPFVRVNMAELLPMELLAHVVSFLPAKDINSLSGTNKTVQRRLNKQHRTTIPISLMFIVNSSYEPRYLKVEAWASPEGRYYTFCCNLIDWHKETARNCELSKEEQLAEIRDFYTPRRGGSHGERRKVYNFGIKEGLSAHLNALLSQNFLIKSLRLEGLSSKELNIVEAFFRENNMTRTPGETCQPASATSVPTTSTSKCTVPKCPLVRKLIICSNRFRQIHLDILVACKAKAIKIIGAVQVPGLLQTQTFRELEKISYAGNFTVEEGELPALVASSITLFGVKEIPSKDVQTFMNQWTQSRRTIENFELRANDESPCEIPNLLSGLDHDLVTFEEIDRDIYEHGPSYSRECRLIRKSDGEAILCQSSDSAIRVTADDLEPESASPYASNITIASSTSWIWSTTASGIEEDHF